MTADLGRRCQSEDFARAAEVGKRDAGGARGFHTDSARTADGDQEEWPDWAAQQAKGPLPRWLAETGFAAAYFLKTLDLIPDHIPEIGLADDALILQRVIERNQSELTAVWPKVSTLTAGSSR